MMLGTRSFLKDLVPCSLSKENFKMPDHDIKCLEAAIETALSAREHGNHPFGAVLADSSGKILLRAENTVVTSRDITAHAELNLVREATSNYEPEFLATCTLYSSTEPCPMCAGGIFWSNIRRVVYGLSEEGLYEITGDDTEEVLLLSCREVFAQGEKSIEVVGPLLEEKAREPHLGFWESISEI
jgi:tRNA(Arg) A34 adenosine deaminase TadA